VSAVPDVTSFAIGAAQRFVLMGCDGVWKVHLLSTRVLSLAISRYVSLSLVISRYLSLSLAISRYLSPSLTISPHTHTVRVLCMRTPTLTSTLSLPRPITAAPRRELRSSTVSVLSTSCTSGCRNWTRAARSSPRS
jgi:hypothetical protein